MLQRKAYEHLVKWKNTTDKKALLITGARQIGKTYYKEICRRKLFKLYRDKFHHKSRCRKDIQRRFECRNDTD